MTKAFLKLTEDINFKKSLVGALNSKTLIPGMEILQVSGSPLILGNVASTADLKKLELYADLTSMPKFSVDAEPSTSTSSTLIPTSAAFVSGSVEPLIPTDDSPTPSSIPIGAPELSTHKTTKAKGRKQRKTGAEEGDLTKREMGRLKVKEAVMKKARELAEMGVDVKADVMEEAIGDDEERSTKKLKAQEEVLGQGGDADVMADV